MGDILEPAGCNLLNYRRNPVVLAQHDPNQPIARCSSIGIAGGKVVATIDFPQEGINDTSDTYLRLVKTGVLNAVSVGFVPTEWVPLTGGRGMRFTKWEMLELSIVSVPANPNATVTERGFGKVHPPQSSLAEHIAAVVWRRQKEDASRRADACETDGAELATVADRTRDLAAIRARHGLKPAADPHTIVAEAAFRLRRW